MIARVSGKLIHCDEEGFVVILSGSKEVIKVFLAKQISVPASNLIGKFAEAHGTCFVVDGAAKFTANIISVWDTQENSEFEPLFSTQLAAH